MQTNLPPEAFTKETLQEAFQWLQNQPDSVRELVHTPESLVSLYRKASRQDNDAPVSSKNFMSELKTLAKGLEAFSDGTTQVPQNFQVPEPKVSAPAHTFSQPQSFKASTPAFTPEPQPTKKPLQVPAQQAPSTLNLDQKSAQCIAEVRTRFNLSSDLEATRLLLALGYEKFNSFD